MISVQDLTKRYRKATRNAVDGISFQVGAGEFFALLGPNGAGKTTTISILTTTLAPTAGRATIDGHDVVDRRQRGPPARRDHLPAPEPRPEPDGRGERPLPRGPLRPLSVPAGVPAHARGVPAPGRGAGRDCWASSASSSTRSGRTRAACAASSRSSAACCTGRGAVPRRADGRPRRRRAAARCGSTSARSARESGTTIFLTTPLPRGGRAGRPDLHHRSRPDRGRGHAGAAQGRARARDADRRRRRPGAACGSSSRGSACGRRRRAVPAPARRADRRTRRSSRSRRR